MTEPTRYGQDVDVDLETPENDAADQQRGVDDTELDDRAGDKRVRRETPLEVDPADAADQDRVAGVDEDDYR